MEDTQILVAQLDAISSDSVADNTSRERLIASARDMLNRLQTPFERIMHQVVIQPLLTVAIQVALDIKLFHQFRSSSDVKTTEELAALTNTSQALLARILRLLSSCGILVEKDCDIFAASSLAIELSSPTWSSSFAALTKIYRAPTNLLPQYLRDLEYKNPDANIDSAFNVAHDTKSYWDWFREHPTEAKGFQAAMVVRAHMAPRWITTYPVHENLLVGASTDPSSPLLVDVGGGVGPDIAAFRAAFPDAKGRLILQDLPAVMTQAEASGKLNQSIVLMPHNFFEVQPIRGARIYYLGNVLHDWGDADAARILTRLRDAMKPGYSRILIQEAVIPDRDASAIVAASDILMMVMSNAKERTESMWKDLVRSVEGLEVLNIWGDMGAYKSVIEVDLIR